MSNTIYTYQYSYAAKISQPGAAIQKFVEDAKEFKKKLDDQFPDGKYIKVDK